MARAVPKNTTPKMISGKIRVPSFRVGTNIPPITIRSKPVIPPNRLSSRILTLDISSRGEIFVSNLDLFERLPGRFSQVSNYQSLNNRFLFV